MPVTDVNVDNISNGWQVVALLGSGLIVVFGMWLMNVTKRGADRKTDDTDKVTKEAERAADLGPAVQALSESLTKQGAELAKQREELTAAKQEIELMKPVVTVKYPASIEHIRRLHRQQPSLYELVPIPAVIVADVVSETDE